MRTRCPSSVVPAARMRPLLPILILAGSVSGLPATVAVMSNRTPWRKMHLAIDPAMNVHGIAITDTAVSDSEGMDLVMPVQTPIAKAIADGAYYSIERGEALFNVGVLPVIPPPSHAVVHGKDNTTWHDALGKRSAIPS